MPFFNRLRNAWRKNNSLLCVGLDPDPQRLPNQLVANDANILNFCCTIVDATADLVCAFKPQAAYFQAYGYESALSGLISYIHNKYPDIPVILDSKRGDIGATAKQYAIEAFERYNADAVTINPYMGRDSAQAFLDYADRGIIILCHTSNPGAGEFQELTVTANNPSEGNKLYLRVAQNVAEHWNEHGNCALVVGATVPAELACVRQLVGSMPILLPGIGAQGGDIGTAVLAGRDKDRTGLIINSSRAILYASNGADFAQAARQVAIATRDAINTFR